MVTVSVCKKARFLPTILLLFCYFCHKITVFLSFFLENWNIIGKFAKKSYFRISK